MEVVDAPHPMKGCGPRLTVRWSGEDAQTQVSIDVPSLSSLGMHLDGSAWFLHDGPCTNAEYGGKPMKIVSF